MIPPIPTLRSATSADSSAVRELVARILGEYGLTLDGSGVDTDLDDIEASYIKSGGSFHVLVDSDGRIVGSVGLMPRGDGICELRKMYLVSTARGRGYGKLMLRTVLDDARRLGFRRIELDTLSVMKEAAALYTSHGFEPMAVAHSCCRCDRKMGMDL